MANLRSLPLCVLTTALLSCTALAQSAAPAARIVSPVDDNQLVALKGNVNPLANAKNDRGPVSASLPMAGMVLVLSRSADEQAAFDAYVAGEYDPSSPDFHQWLSPQQIGAQYGPAPADIAAITGWLSSQGFTVKNVAPDGMSITFTGSAGQAESAFHTEIHNLSVNGKMHIGNMTAPQIPAALAPVVAGIKGLHNFLPHPMHRVGSTVKFNPDAHGWVKLQSSRGAHFAAGSFRAPAPGASANSASSTKPNFSFTIPGSNDVLEEDVAPYDFAKIYSLPSTWPSSTNGSGQTIVIIGTSDIEQSDVSAYKTAFGLPTGLSLVTAHGPDGDPGNCGGNPDTDACTIGDVVENSNDVEVSGAVAPSAQIVLVTDAYNSQTDPTNDPLYDGAQWVIDNAYVSGSQVSGARIMSMSYGGCELFNGTAATVAYNNLWETAYAAGIAVFVSTGDSGSTSCDDGEDGYYGNPYEAQYGLSVSAQASSPYDTAVGGTDFSWCNPTVIQSGSNAGYIQGCSSSNASTYWNTSNSSQQSSAKGYVPETPWNDTCENPIDEGYLESVATYFAANGYNLGTFSTPEGSCNYIYENVATLVGLNEQYGTDPLVEYVDTVGGSGGASNCVVSSTTATTLGSCNSTDSSTGSTYGNLTLANDGWPSPSWQSQSGVPGTSGLTARALPDVSFFAGDGGLDSATLICLASAGASCTDINATSSSPVYGGTSTTGALEIGGTSVATPEMAGVMALINQKAGAPQGNPNAELYTLAGKQTYSECSAEGPPGASCYFNSIDQGTNAQPCALSGDLEGGAEYDSSEGYWITTRGAAATASPNCTASGSDAVGTLSGFSAAAGYNEATGLGSLNIANILAANGAWTAVAGTASSISISLGGVTSIQPTQSLTVTGTVSGSNGTPAGNVTLLADLEGADSTYTSTVALSGGSYTFTIPANTFTAAGTETLTAEYGGSSTYGPSVDSTTVAVTTSSAPTGTFTLGSITNPPSIAAGATATATASISSSNGYAGTITFNCVLTGQPTNAVNLPSCSPNATVTLSATATSGSATLSVTTTAATIETSRLAPANRRGLLGAGGAVLAFLVFLGVPARRRSWRAMLGMVVLLITLGSLAACGGGGGSSTTTIPGTTAGTYTFTVTPEGSPAPSSAAATQTFMVTVTSSSL